jgi:site-specific DNA-cytosine methylase
VRNGIDTGDEAKTLTGGHHQSYSLNNLPVLTLFDAPEPQPSPSSEEVEGEVAPTNQPMAFVKRHGANHSEDEETWEPADVARALNGMGQAGTNGALAVEPAEPWTWTHEERMARPEEGTSGPLEKPSHGANVPTVFPPSVVKMNRTSANGGNVTEGEAPTLDRDTRMATTVGRRMGTKGPDSDATTTMLPATGTVRRLTPTECERLQGFPDGWTIQRR